MHLEEVAGGRFGRRAYLENFTGKQVCSKQLYKEALNHPFDEPKQWEIREINEIMNNSVKGWKQFSNPRYFSSYGRQRGWERDNSTDATEEKSMDGFVELIEEAAKQMELPF